MVFMLATITSVNYWIICLTNSSLGWKHSTNIRSSVIVKAFAYNFLRVSPMDDFKLSLKIKPRMGLGASGRSKVKLII